MLATLCDVNSGINVEAPRIMLAASCDRTELNKPGNEGLKRGVMSCQDDVA